MRTTMGVLLALGLFSAGCDSNDAPKSAGSTSAATSGSAKAPATAAATAPGGGGKGLAAAGNNAEVVALAKKAVACKWADGDWDWACADLKAWTEGKAVEKQDVTVVNMLEDADDKVRSLAVLGLSSGDTYRSDKALAERVIAAAETEKSEKIDFERFGGSIGAIKVGPTGTFERVKKLIQTGPDKLKKGILGMVNFSNNNDDAVFDYVVGLTKDSNERVHRAALGSFWNIGQRRIDDKCKLYKENVANADDEMSGPSAMGISQCLDKADKVDALLDEVDKRVKAGTKVPAQFGNGVAMMLDKGSKAADAQKKRAVKSGIALLECEKCTNDSKGRMMKTLFAADNAAVKPVLEKLAKDKDASLAKNAKDVLEGK